MMDKLKALDEAIRQIERSYGKGAIMKLGGQEKIDIETTPTGSIGLDIALGTGGVPKGRIVEIFGPESSGKTTLALHIIAQVQKLGGTAAFIDAEHAFDPVYGKNLGIDIENLLISQPDSGEQALEIVDTLVRSGGIDILVVDSVAALVPRAELEGEMGDSHMGLQARLMSQALRKLTGSISRTHTTVVFINQLRMKIGMSSFMGPLETTTGGNALKFYSSIRLDIRRIAAIKDKDEIIGNRTRVKVVKNKLSPPFKTAEFDILYGKGVSRIGELIDLGIDLGFIKKSGAWYSYKEQRLGQGREKVRQALIDSEDLQHELYGAILKEKGVLSKNMLLGDDKKDSFDNKSSNDEPSNDEPSNDGTSTDGTLDSKKSNDVTSNKITSKSADSKRKKG